MNNTYLGRLNYVLEQRLMTHKNISFEEKENLQKQLNNIFNQIENSFGLHPLPESKVDTKVLCKFYLNNVYPGKGASRDLTGNVIMTWILLGSKKHRELRILTYKNSMPKEPDEKRFEFELEKFDTIKEELFSYLSRKTGKQYIDSSPQNMQTKHKTVTENILSIADLKSSDYTKPERIKTLVTRFIRDTKLSNALKEEYNYMCQICGHTIHLPNGKFYAEAHHIKPLGNGHDGDDIKENLIVVCPNHHAALDYGVIDLDNNILKYHRGNIDQTYIDYHNQNIYKGNNED